jgi:hypothetical protein
MRIGHLVLMTLTVALAAGPGAAPAAAQAEPAAGPQDPRRPGFVAGTGAIAGRVFDARTGGPVRRARIEAASVRPLPPVVAASDDEGRFQLLDLPAGHWRVTVSKGGYVTWQLGQRRPFQAPEPTAVEDGERLAVEIALTKGGVIAGSLYDEAGEPLEGLQVRVYRARMANGHRRLEPVGAADRTDDTGAYRVHGLPPGDYYVAASLRVAPADSVVETTYAPTYYPGTGDLADAQRIRLGLGEEATASFALQPVRRVSVTGAVLTSAGSPANAFLTLTSESAELGVPLGIGGVTRADGTFTIPDVPPGRYMLSASLRGNGPSEVASMPVVVVGEDITGATLVTGRPATLRGRFVVDPSAPDAVPGGLGASAVAARPGGTVLSAASGASFELDELGEPFHLRIDGLPGGWAVKQVLVNGLDVTDSRIALGLGQQADARIVLTSRAAEVGGTVASGGGPGAGMSVVVFHEDPSKWTPPFRSVRAARADGRGRFRIEGLPPGERYLVVATDFLEEGEHYDPEFLSRMREAAVAFGLTEGESRALDLTVTPR